MTNEATAFYRDFYPVLNAITLKAETVSDSVIDRLLTACSWLMKDDRTTILQDIYWVLQNVQEVKQASPKAVVVTDDLRKVIEGFLGLPAAKSSDLVQACRMKYEAIEKLAAEITGLQEQAVAMNRHEPQDDLLADIIAAHPDEQMVDVGDIAEKLGLGEKPMSVGGDYPAEVQEAFTKAHGLLDEVTVLLDKVRQ
jgi:hypothetical protein